MNENRKTILVNEEEIAFRTISCSKMSEKEIQQTSKLFSENYGTWSEKCPYVNRRGENIKFTEKMVRDEFVNKPDRYVSLAYIGDELVGHIFYLFKKPKKLKNEIVWILQLVVDKKYRGNRIATKLMFSMYRLSNCYAWGLFTSNPKTINVLEKGTMRPINVSLIDKHINKIREVASDIFDSTDWIDNYSDGIVNTNFHTDHSNLQGNIEKVYPNGDFPLNPNLPEGCEWLAFTFNSQEPSVDSIDEYLSYSNDIAKRAYSKMDMKNQKWTQYTEQEVDFLEENYIEKNDKILDIGCGFGRHTIELCKRGYNAKGIDFSEKNIERANKILPGRFICKDILSYTPEDRYNVVLCLYDVVGSFPRPIDNSKILKFAHQALNDGGRLLLSVMNMELTEQKCKNTVNYVNKEIKSLLKLAGSNRMQKTGEVFDGENMLIDKATGIVYRKEQFFSEDDMTYEYIVRDRRYYIDKIVEIVENKGFIVDDYFCFRAGHIYERLKSDSCKAKEILISAHKPYPGEKDKQCYSYKFLHLK